jgi:REP element-mobilizing transposase RayT
VEAEALIRLYHVNFHTLGNKPVFLAEDLDASIRQVIRDVMQTHRIVCLALEVMPTHVHVIFLDFPDLDRGRALNLLKGASARLFLERHRYLREELGDHLWQEGYSWLEISSHEQLARTLAYIRGNRSAGGLDPQGDQ